MARPPGSTPPGPAWDLGQAAVCDLGVGLRVLVHTWGWEVPEVLPVLWASHGSWGRRGVPRVPAQCAPHLLWLSWRCARWVGGTWTLGRQCPVFLAWPGWAGRSEGRAELRSAPAVPLRLCMPAEEPAVLWALQGEAQPWGLSFRSPGACWVGAVGCGMRRPPDPGASPRGLCWARSGPLPPAAPPGLCEVLGPKLQQQPGEGPGHCGFQA